MHSFDVAQIINALVEFATVTALVLSIYQIFQARQQTKQLSTQFRGNFPRIWLAEPIIIAGQRESADWRFALCSSEAL
jgi:hypothetical protein